MVRGETHGPSVTHQFMCTMVQLRLGPDYLPLMLSVFGHMLAFMCVALILVTSWLLTSKQHIQIHGSCMQEW